MHGVKLNKVTTDCYLMFVCQHGIANANVNTNTNSNSNFSVKEKEKGNHGTVRNYYGHGNIHSHEGERYGNDGFSGNFICGSLGEIREK